MFYVCFYSRRLCGRSSQENEDEVRVAWEQKDNILNLIGSVIVDSIAVKGNAKIRNRIFNNEMPTALQALCQGDRFLFNKDTRLDDTLVFIHFISENPTFDKIYNFEAIGYYK